MENNLEVAGVDENEKVLFATHYLAGPARAWWTSARALNAGQMMTWADFKLKFNKYHVPPGLIKKMRDEFRELKQGRMSVVEYRDTFLTLSRKRDAQTCPDVHAHARACTASATGTPRHDVVPLLCVTPSSSLCATSSATSPATRWTTPLARANAVADDLVDDHRRGTERFHHALVLALASLSTQSSPASPPDPRQPRCIIASTQNPL
ncbi:hypothetical protein QYE76_001578 [Lolium multiflorum]|uniref:Retrotransposon gag domain-containing protein n=1 Tax=Lolium multiflorum TaxID=4521 RepID=A0AAD8RLM3_LOLMU|nr:hypothetical protein QYE76_001578 [Lolium multiflorum]